jgi:hypothetical protein
MIRAGHAIDDDFDASLADMALDSLDNWEPSASDAFEMFKDSIDIDKARIAFRHAMKFFTITMRRKNGGLMMMLDNLEFASCGHV